MPKNRKVLVAVVAALMAFLGMAAQPSTAPAKDGTRQLASTQKQIESLRQQEHKSRTVINFWNNKGRWALHLHRDKCWQAIQHEHRGICQMARQSLAEHTLRYKVIEAKLDKLEVPRDTGYLPPTAAMRLGQKMAALKGWVGEQWNCLKQLWGPLESRWRVYADNPGSDAYGIPQALPGSKMGTGWQNSAYVQIKWGLGYVSGRFGLPCSALAFRLSRGWY